MAATYFVTGASGFIGKRLVRALLERGDVRVYYLMRDMAPERIAALNTFWGDSGRALPIEGDLLRPDLGLSAKDVKKLKGRVDHFFHLAAVYDLAADAAVETATNVEGTRNAVGLARAIGAGIFHHMSSIAAAGLYHGVFREDMSTRRSRWTILISPASTPPRPSFARNAGRPGASTVPASWSGIPAPAKWTRLTDLIISSS